MSGSTTQCSPPARGGVARSGESDTRYGHPNTGEMFADKGGGDLTRKYPTTWAAWLSRKNDQAVVVRQCFVETAKGVLINMTLPEQREQIGGTYLEAQVSSTLPQSLPEALQDKLLDPDEKIRAAVCRLYSQLDYETALHHVSTLQLKGVANRGIDRRVSFAVLPFSMVS